MAPQGYWILITCATMSARGLMTRQLGAYDCVQLVGFSAVEEALRPWCAMIGNC